VQAAAQHADYHSGLDEGDSILYWEPPQNPTRLWLNLFASTPIMFQFGFSGLHLVYSASLLVCTELHLATTRVFWCSCLSNFYKNTRYTPSGRMGCVALFPTWLWSQMVLGQCELAC
jgi:hypothetical protein